MHIHARARTHAQVPVPEPPLRRPDRRARIPEPRRGALTRLEPLFRRRAQRGADARLEPQLAAHRCLRTLTRAG
eukprot:scaffold89267_cov63-Phaeocystis_antarctica.AAC.2